MGLGPRQAMPVSHDRQPITLLRKPRSGHIGCPRPRAQTCARAERGAKEMLPGVLLPGLRNTKIGGGEGKAFSKHRNWVT